jgi:hypothetical protein
VTSCCQNRSGDAFVHSDAKDKHGRSGDSAMGIDRGPNTGGRAELSEAVAIPEFLALLVRRRWVSYQDVTFVAHLKTRSLISFIFRSFDCVIRGRLSVSSPPSTRLFCGLITP